MRWRTIAAQHAPVLCVLPRSTDSCLAARGLV